MIVIRLAEMRGQATSFCTEMIRAEGLRMPSRSLVQDRVAPRRDCTMTQLLPMTHLPVLAAAPKPKPKPKRTPPPARTRIVCQIWRAAEKQVAQVEARLAMLGDEPQSLEREAKTLGIIARTVRDLIVIDEEKAKAKSGAKRSETDEDGHGSPMSLAEFRRELAKKLDQLRAERSGGGASGEALSTGD